MRGPEEGRPESLSKNSWEEFYRYENRSKNPNVRSYRRELDSGMRVTRAARDGRKEGAKCIKT